MYSIDFGSKSFRVRIEQCDVKRFSISVSPNLDVLAKAPLACSMEMIHSKIKKKKAWIAKQIRYFEQFHPLPPDKCFISGETHYYLGRQYRLKIQKTESKQQVKLTGRFFNVYLVDLSDNQKAKQLMDYWYLTHAKEYFSSRIKKYSRHFENITFGESMLRCRKMKTRWGSCSPNGVITLNTSLVKTPTHCIDYVITHELCHLIFPNHTSSFYSLLERVLPDWKTRKKRLELTNF